MRLRKFEFDPAPLVLGLVIAPIFEQSLRQSLIMSNGNYTDLLQPADLGRPAGRQRLPCWRSPRCRFVLKRKDWRAKLAEVEAGEVEPERG